MRYHTLLSMSAAKLAKVLVEEFAIFKIKLSFLKDNLLQTQLKTAHKVGTCMERRLHNNTIILDYAS